MFLLAASAKRQAGNVQRARGALSRPLHSVAQGLLRALIACFSCQAADGGEVSLLGLGAHNIWALVRINEIRGPTLAFIWVTQKTRASAGFPTQLGVSDVWTEASSTRRGDPLLQILSLSLAPSSVD